MAVRKRILVETLAANRTITAAEFSKYEIFAFDPGGAARDVTLPTEAASGGTSSMAVEITILNAADAAEVITIKNDAGTGLTGATPTQAEGSIVTCDGTSWWAIGTTT